MTEKQAEIRATKEKGASTRENAREEERGQAGDESRERPELSVAEAREKESAEKPSALVGAAKAIEEGAHFVGEKAPEVASFVIHKVRKGVSVAYGAGSTFVKEAYQASRDYADKYKHRIEIKRLRAQREAVTARLGSIIYSRIFVDGEPPDKVFSEQEVTGLYQEIQDLDNEIVRSGEELQEQ